MRCCNGGSLAALVGTALGAEVGPREAQVGDVALVRQRGREALAVCVGGHLLAPGEKKLEYLPLSSIERVWRCARD